MSRNNRSKKIKTKKRKAKGHYIIAVLIILLYFFSRMSPFLNASTQSTYTAEYIKTEKTIECVGFVAREEKVFTSIGEGSVKYFVSEGEKIAKGQKLAEVYLEQLDEKTIKDLETINLRLQNIKEKQNEEGFFKNDIEKIEQQILTLVGSIKQSLKEEKYDKIINVKKELENLLDKKSIIAGEKSFSGKNIDELERQKNQLEEKISSSVQTIYSDSSGFIAIGSDGLEQLLNYKLLHEVTSKQLKMLKDNELILPSKDVEEGQPIIRIIENYKWSIIAEIGKEHKYGGNIEKGQSVQIRTIDGNKELKATVRNVITEKDKNIIIFDTDEFIADFYNVRMIDIEIILEQYEGIMVANSSIVEKDGVKGIYVVDVGGIPDFKPIKIKVSNSDYSILYDGHFEQKSKDDPEKMEQIKTISLYDRVVMNGDKVKEGKRIK